MKASKTNLDLLVTPEEASKILYFFEDRLARTRVRRIQEGIELVRSGQARAYYPARFQGVHLIIRNQVTKQAVISA